MRVEQGGSKMRIHQVSGLLLGGTLNILSTSIFFPAWEKITEKKSGTRKSISCSISFYMFVSVLCFHGICSVFLWHLFY